MMMGPRQLTSEAVAVCVTACRKAHPMPAALPPPPWGSASSGPESEGLRSSEEAWRVEGNSGQWRRGMVKDREVGCLSRPYLWGLQTQSHPGPPTRDSPEIAKARDSNTPDYHHLADSVYRGVRHGGQSRGGTPLSAIMIKEGQATPRLVSDPSRWAGQAGVSRVR